MQTILMIIFWCSAAQLSIAINIRPLLPIPTQPPTAIRTLRTIIPPTTTKTTTTTTTTTIRQKCPSSFIYNATFDKCYLSFGYSTATWANSNNNCINNGARLVMPKSQSESIFVESLLPGYPIWLGATYRTINGRDDYYWLDDNTTISLCTEGLYAYRDDSPYAYLYPGSACWANMDSGRELFTVCERAPLP